jgi:hypothetical protein
MIDYAELAADTPADYATYRAANRASSDAVSQLVLVGVYYPVLSAAYNSVRNVTSNTREIVIESAVDQALRDSND